MEKAYAYFDESGTDEKSTVLCVAGYIFLEESVDQFEAEWKVMLRKHGVPFFHATDCMHGHGSFRRLNPAQRTEAQKDAIAIIKKHAAKGIALSIDKVAFDRVSIDAPALWSTPYTFLCGQVLFGVRDWANEVGFHGEIEYVFEAGAVGQIKAVEETTGALLQSVETRQIFRYGKHTHETKTGAVQLQAADLLVWHWFTHQRRIKEGKGKRADFRELVGLKIDPHHYDAQAIDLWQTVWRATVRIALRKAPVHSSMAALFGSLGRLK